MSRRHLFPHAVLLLVAWGAFAFGAEFTWAYAPLLVFSVAVSVLGLLAAPGGVLRFHRELLLALGLAIAAALVQLVPLPASLVASISPHRDAVDYLQLFSSINLFDPPAPLDPASLRPLSIAPARGWLGLAFAGALALLLVASAAALSGVGTRLIVRTLIVFGVVAALAETIQKASDSSIVYGLFTPRQQGYTSAPFVNRNHTAGWLIMVMSLSLGHLAGCVAHGMRVKPVWRERVLWLSSRRASEVVLTASAIAVMAIAVVLTESRSGSLCLILLSLMFGWASLRTQSSRSRRAFVAVHLAAVLLVAAVMGGAGAVQERFASGRLENLDGRLDVWRDTAAIISDFPATGTGLNTFGIAMLHYQKTQHGDIRYIESHNDYLQLAAEGGLLLTIPVMLVAAAVARATWQRFREGRDDPRTYWLRVGAVCGLIAIAFQSIFEFTLQMPGGAVMFVMLLAIAVHRPASPSDAR